MRDIFEHLDIYSKVNLIRTHEHFHYLADSITKLNCDCEELEDLTDKDLRLFRNLKSLTCNENMTDNGIRHLG